MTITVDNDVTTTDEPTPKAPAPEPTGIMLVMRGGAPAVTWHVDDAASVEAAREKFDTYVKTGNLAYKANGPDGGGEEQIKTFDPTARHIVIAAPNQGG